MIPSLHTDVVISPCTCRDDSKAWRYCHGSMQMWLCLQADVALLLCRWGHVYCTNGNAFMQIWPRPCLPQRLWYASMQMWACFHTDWLWLLVDVVMIPCMQLCTCLQTDVAIFLHITWECLHKDIFMPKWRYRHASEQMCGCFKPDVTMLRV